MSCFVTSLGFLWYLLILAHDSHRRVVLREKGRAGVNTLTAEVLRMIAAAWLMLSSLLYSLQLSTGSFPKPLTEEEERHYLALAQEGDLDARNVLIERNLRLVAHIMNKG